jgi:tRNA 2-thiouridine synthesizing protein A
MTEITTQVETSTLDLEAFDLDCSGLLCPLPVYKAALVLNQLPAGGLLRLVTTDPGALRDIPAMARQRGDALVEVVESENNQTFLIEKAPQS